jgi:hypothetical protein
MNLTAIIPRLPPVVDGIGDYALCLARLLRDNLEITTQFIVTDTAWIGTGEVEGFEVRRMTSHSAVELLKLLAGDSSAGEQVLLHYEGYGYATRGCPFWLVDALERWRLASDTRRLITMFHELYAKGPPWTSSFWLSPVQKNLTARLARLSDESITSLNLYAQIVRRMGIHDPARVHCMPVFSTVREPAVQPALGERRKRLVVFGSHGRRALVYKRSAESLNRICLAMGLEEVVDIGRLVGFDISRVIGLPVLECGELPASEVSEALLDSVAGVIDYPAVILGKSTIFAAYCSHRIIPIVATSDGRLAGDGLEANTHYWRTETPTERLSIRNGQPVADAALAWYQGHNLANHGDLFAAILGVHGFPDGARPVDSKTQAVMQQ